MKNTQDLINVLNEDLKNEYKHMLFYLHAGVVIQGFHREEIGEFLLGEAKEEMVHVEEFSRKIIGLDGVPVTEANSYRTDLTDPKDILQYVLDMENEVADIYARQLVDTEELGGTDGLFIHVFLEDQLLHSRNTADHVKEMLKSF